MAMITLRGQGSFESITQTLAGQIQDSGLSCQLVDSVVKDLGSVKIAVMVFEKYFMRSSNRTSLTVVVTGQGSDLTVDAIGSGGGQGPIFKFSWGAEESFIGTVGNILHGYGFR